MPWPRALLLMQPRRGSPLDTRPARLRSQWTPLVQLRRRLPRRQLKLAARQATRSLQRQWKLRSLDASTATATTTLRTRAVRSAIGRRSSRRSARVVSAQGRAPTRWSCRRRILLNQDLQPCPQRRLARVRCLLRSRPCLLQLFQSGLTTCHNGTTCHNSLATRLWHSRRRTRMATAAPRLWHCGCAPT